MLATAPARVCKESKISPLKPIKEVGLGEIRLMQILSSSSLVTSVVAVTLIYLKIPSKKSTARLESLAFLVILTFA